jgi:hypothetical protein
MDRTENLIYFHKLFRLSYMDTKVSIARRPRYLKFLNPFATAFRYILKFPSYLLSFSSVVDDFDDFGICLEKSSEGFSTSGTFPYL